MYATNKDRDTGLFTIKISVDHVVRHGFKMGGGPKTIIELESEPKFNINLYKIISNFDTCF